MSVEYTPQEIKELLEASLRPKAPIEQILDSDTQELLKSEYKIIAQFCKAKRFLSGDVLFYEGDEANCAYLLIQGVVSVNRDGEFVKALKIGDLAGKIGANETSTRCSTVTCVTDGIALEIGKNELQELTFKHPKIGFKFMLAYKTQIELLGAL